jgi:hypothetical protein
MTLDQTALVDAIGVAPSGDQSVEQAENLAIQGFLWLCELEGCLPLPSEGEARRALRGRAGADTRPAV